MTVRIKNSKTELNINYKNKNVLITVTCMITVT